MPVTVVMPVTVAMSVAMSVTVTMSVTIYEVDEVAMSVAVAMPMSVPMPVAVSVSVAVTEVMYEVADEVPSFVSGLRGPSHARQRKHEDDGTSEDRFHSLFSYASQWGDFTGRRYILSGQALFPREQDRCRCQISKPSAGGHTTGRRRMPCRGTRCGRHWCPGGGDPARDGSQS
jgi:hypothetical protein